MSDFEFPSSAFPSSRTILGGASPVSDRWSYLRTRQWPDGDDDAGRSGTAPNVEPPPGSPEYQTAETGLASLQDTPEPTAASAAAALGIADAAESPLGARLAGLAARVPSVVAAAPEAALAVPLIAIPLNSDGLTLPLGDGFRARQPPGQRSVIVERRVSDGLLGTSVGAKWEEVPPLDATLRIGRFGLPALVVDADQLQNTLGPDATKQLFATSRVIDRQADQSDSANRTRAAPGGQSDLPPPPPLSLPAKLERRIRVLLDGSADTEKREATRDEVQSFCPNYAIYEQIGLKAGEKYKAAGMENGLAYGQRVHRSLEDSLKMHDIQSSLHERGVFELNPELALLNGIDKSYTKGSSRLDVVELHSDHITVCVYELKTGGAQIRDETIDRYLKEASLYVKFLGFGYPNVYFLPIKVP